LQLRRILQHDLLAQAHEDTPILLGGDFNDVWSTLGKKVLLPKGYHPAGDPIRTFPALLPLRSLDRLFFRGPLRLHHAFSSRTRLARQASDHLPLVADFRVQVP
jgi:endonuclease/exonuclease/phosphatase family metal-dependent hydrolase